MKVKFISNCVAEMKEFFFGDIAELNDQDARYLLNTGRVVKFKEEIESIVVEEKTISKKKVK